MSYSDRELIARLIECEAGGEGESGMKAVATVILNRVNATEGEYSRISNGGNVKNVVFQPKQFVCASESIQNKYNPRNIYNMNPTEIHYEIADWALAGNRLNEVGESLWFLNPISSDYPEFFPANGSGKFHTVVGAHYFYKPTEQYKDT